jgi:tetratricopeptide (TPR) repeat protein
MAYAKENTLSPNVVSDSQKQMLAGANWFIWIVLLSLINTIIFLSGGEWNFIIGLGITQIIDAFGVELANEIGGIAKFIAIALDLLVLTFYGLIYFFAKKGQRWAFITGMISYALDGILFLMVGDILGVIFHGLALFFIGKGFMASSSMQEDTSSNPFLKAAKIIEPYALRFGRGSQHKLTLNEKDKIFAAITSLKQLTHTTPDYWQAYWIMGKGYQVLGNEEHAYNAFASAYAIEKTNVDVIREYAGACLNLGKGQEGVKLAQEALSLQPDNPGLIANLGLALLINKEVDRAMQEVEKALAKNPSDHITKNLLETIKEIKYGHRRMPEKLSDLAGTK